MNAPHCCSTGLPPIWSIIGFCFRGVTVLARLVASVRDRARQRLWRQLSIRVDDEKAGRLEELLVVDGDRQSRFDRLRTAPSRPSGAGLVDAMERLDEIRPLGADQLHVSGLPESAVRQLARHASAAKAQTVARMAPPTPPSHVGGVHPRAGERRSRRRTGRL